MRFLLFYGAIESLRHFTDELCEQIRQQGHEAHIIVLNTSWREQWDTIVMQKVDAAICYDGIGMDPIGKLYDEFDIPVINILVDHPMDMSFRIRNHTKKYIQFSPDEHHITYAKRFLGVENAFFLPHMASLEKEPLRIPFEEKSIPLLMPGGLFSCNELYQKIKDQWADEKVQLLILGTMEYMIDHPELTMEDALQTYAADHGMWLPDESIATLMENSRDADLFVRMYFRSRVVSLIASTDIPLTLIGSGWNELTAAQRKNVTIVQKLSFVEMFPYMEQSKITLTVMPWFKAGSHERILNSLMHYSCPLTDESSWLLKHFAPDEECAYYSLRQLDALPDTVYNLLNHPEKMNHIVHNGREKVVEHYTSKQILESILNYLKECYG